MAETLTDNICCADDFFMDSEGNYNFDVNKLNAAHNYSKNLCETFMKEGKDKIAIANTNTSNKEMKPYEFLANKYGYMVFHLVIENRHGGTDTHNVPYEVKVRQEDRILRNLKLK